MRYGTTQTCLHLKSSMPRTQQAGAHLSAVQSRLNELLLRIVFRCDEERRRSVEHDPGSLHHGVEGALLQQVSLVQGQRACTTTCVRLSHNLVEAIIDLFR